MFVIASLIDGASGRASESEKRVYASERVNHESMKLCTYALRKYAVVRA